MKLKSGQVWVGVKHSPFPAFTGPKVPGVPERIDVLLIARHESDSSDPLWRVQNLPRAARTPGSDFEYWELESVISTGTLIE